MQSRATPLDGRPHISWVDGRWGRSHFFTADKFIGQSLAHYGEYSPDETEFILALAAKHCAGGKIVLDIGANIGAISQALEAGGFNVIAFEPLPEVYEVLSLNVKNTSTINAALADKTGKAKMPRMDYGAQNNYGGFSIGMASATLGHIDVPVRRLDEFGINNVGLIKIDVEGFEENVLRGAIETLERCKPALYIEDDREDKREKLYACLTELGYTQVVPHTPRLFRPHNHFDNAQNIWGTDFISRNLYCVKPDA